VYTSGDTASLPCDISVPQPGVDELTLVMWYREDVGSPIYSIGKFLKNIYKIRIIRPLISNIFSLFDKVFEK